MRSETSFSALTASPVGRTYVLWTFCSSIMRSSPSRLVYLAHEYFVTLTKTADNLQISVISNSGANRALLDRAAMPAQHKLPSAFAAHGARWKHQGIFMSRQLNPDRGSHLWSQNAITGWLKLHDSHVVDHVVADLGLWVNRCDLAFELVIAVSINGESGFLSKPDSPDVSLINVRPDLQPRQIEKGHE